jgi:hypothetical protein
MERAKATSFKRLRKEEFISKYEHMKRDRGPGVFPHFYEPVEMERRNTRRLKFGLKRSFSCQEGRASSDPFVFTGYVLFHKLQILPMSS